MPQINTVADTELKSATPPTQDRTIQTLRRRLERWELDHLRTLAAELSDRLDRAQDEAERAKEERDRAWESAESWQRHAENLQQELWAAGGEIGLTQDGVLLVSGPEKADLQRQRDELLEAAQAAADLLTRQKWKPGKFDAEAIVLAKLLAAITSVPPTGA